MLSAWSQCADFFHWQHVVEHKGRLDLLCSSEGSQSACRVTCTSLPWLRLFPFKPFLCSSLAGGMSGPGVTTCTLRVTLGSVPLRSSATTSEMHSESRGQRPSGEAGYQADSTTDNLSGGLCMREHSGCHAFASELLRCWVCMWRT